MGEKKRMRRIKGRIAVVLSFALLTGCLSPCHFSYGAENNISVESDSGIQSNSENELPDEEIEPNNWKSAATPLSINKPCKCEIGSYEKYKKDGSDVDWYSVKLKEGKKYKINFDDYNRDFASQYLDVELFDDSNNSIDDMAYRFRKYGINYVEFEPEKTGTYYIKISNYIDYRNTRNDHYYFLQVDDITDGYHVDIFESEPNDIIIAATDLTLDQRCRGEIGSFDKYNRDDKMDIDWYHINLSAGRKYRFNMDDYINDFSSTYLIVEMYDENGNLLSPISYIMQRNGSNDYDYTAKYSGSYYIKLYNYLGLRYGVEHYYTWLVTDITSEEEKEEEKRQPGVKYEVEPNSSKSTATKLTVNEECIGEIGSYEKYKKDGSDVDWYAVDLQKNERYRFWMDDYNGEFASTTIILHFLNPNDNEVKTNGYRMSSYMENYGVNYFDFVAKKTGTYYLNLYNYSDSKTEAEHYYALLVQDFNVTVSDDFVAGSSVDIKQYLDINQERVIYKTDNKKIAKVNGKGIVKFTKGSGDVTISAFDKKSKNKLGSVTMHVKVPNVLNKKIELEESSSISHNGCEYITCDDITPTWISSKPSVVTIDSSSGKMDVKGKGTATIYAVYRGSSIKDKNGTKKKYRFKVKVI